MTGHFPDNSGITWTSTDKKDIKDENGNRIWKKANVKINGE
jgi:hypothetical protein